MSRYLTFNCNHFIKIFTIETKDENIIFHTYDETERERIYDNIPSIVFTINDITSENIIVHMLIADDEYEYLRTFDCIWFFGRYNNPITNIPQYLWFKSSQLRVP